MDKIASPDELQSELRRLLAYAESESPSRVKLAEGLDVLANRVKTGSSTLGSQIHEINIQRNKDAAKLYKEFLQDVLDGLEKRLKKEGIKDAKARLQGGHVLGYRNFNVGGHLSAGGHSINFELKAEDDQAILVIEGGGFSKSRRDRLYPDSLTAQEATDKIAHTLLDRAFYKEDDEDIADGIQRSLEREDKYWRTHERDDGGP